MMLRKHVPTPKVSLAETSRGDCSSAGWSRSIRLLWFTGVLLVAVALNPANARQRGTAVAQKPKVTQGRKASPPGRQRVGVAPAKPHPAPAKPATITEPEFHYSFIPPAGWKRVVTGVPANAVAFLGPYKQNFSVNLTVYAERVGNVTLAQFTAGARRLPQQIKGITLVDEQNRLLAGIAAHQWTQQTRIAGKPPADSLQVFALYHGDAVVITLTTPAGTLPQYGVVVHNMLAGFHWVK
ncbi:MAG: hypothetical protein KGJ62_02355 [Armatimonadetes bacterium]|nr:hypothetical protein [Armatimonadota bacterium]MDE2205337.1 hypothetical protein [Armatimonadota bacterium]